MGVNDVRRQISVCAIDGTSADPYFSTENARFKLFLPPISSFVWSLQNLPIDREVASKIRTGRLKFAELTFWKSYLYLMSQSWRKFFNYADRCLKKKYNAPFD